MARVFSKKRIIFWASVALSFVLLPLVFDGGFSLSMLSQMGIAIIFVLSYNMLLGQTGLLSFGHAVYFGLGAFVTAHIVNFIDQGSFWFPITFVPIVGGITGLLFALVLGFVTTRRAGTPFAMISLGIAEMVAASALMFTTFFGGEGGIVTNRTAGGVVAGISYGPQIQVFYLIAGWCLISMMGMYAITRTPLGRLANAVRDNPERVKFIGYNPVRVRWLMMTLSGFFAGVAGALATINYEIITAEALGLMASGNVVLMAFIGGINHFWGPIIGAVLVTLLQSALSTYTQAWLLYFGLFFLIIILYSPGGIANILAVHAPVIKARLFKSLASSYLIIFLASVPLIVGTIAVIEILYRGGAILGMSSLVSWSSSLVLIVVGLVVFRFAQRRVKSVWASLDLELRKRGFV
ncbi:MAG: branched-chain amino acid ABC transporter permease [Betaproteobacteria bacterium]